MLKADMAEANRGTVSLDHMKVEIITIVLDYMYVGTDNIFPRAVDGHGEDLSLFADGETN